MVFKDLTAQTTCKTRGELDCSGRVASTFDSFIIILRNKYIGYSSPLIYHKYIYLDLLEFHLISEKNIQEHIALH